MALFYNINKGKGDPALERKDFYRFDEEKETEKEKVDPEKIKGNVEKILKDRKRG